MGVAMQDISNTKDLSSALQAQLVKLIMLCHFYRAWLAVSVSLRPRGNSTIWLVSTRKLDEPAREDEKTRRFDPRARENSTILSLGPCRRKNSTKRLSLACWLAWWLAGLQNGLQEATSD